MSTIVQRKGIYDNSYTIGGVVSPKGVQLLRSRTGVSMPKYKDNISKLQSATTPLSAYAQSASVKEGALRVTTTKSHSYGEQTFTDTWMGISHGVNGHYYAIPLSDADYFNSTSVRDRALARARSLASDKIKAIQTPFNTQVFAAELKEIRGLFRQPLLEYGRLVEKLARTSKNYRGYDKLVARKKRESRTALADTYLEFQFGVIPLISDIKAIATLFNEKAQQESTNRIHAYAKVDGLVLDSFQIGDYTAGVECQLRLIRKGYTEVFITSGIAAQFQEKLTGIDALSNQLLSLLEVPVAVWESIPYSFLLDYFVNVGDTINATTTARNMVSYTSETVVKNVSYFGTSNFVRISRPDKIQTVEVLEPTKSYEAKLRVVDRTGGSSAIPPLVVTLPGSLTQYANMAALLLSKL